MEKIKIEMTGINGPWDPEVIDYTTSGTKLIDVQEILDTYELSLIAPEELSEANDSLVYTINLDKSLNTSMNITFKNHLGEITTQTLEATRKSKDFSIELPGVDDIYKNEKEYSLEIVDVTLGNGKSLENLIITKKIAKTKIYDNIDVSTIDLFLVDMENKKVIEATVGQQVKIKAKLNAISNYNYFLTLSNGFEVLITSQNNEVYTTSFFLPDEPGVTNITITEIKPMDQLGYISKDDIDLEGLAPGVAAYISIGYPSDVKSRLIGPDKILEGVPFTLEAEIEFEAFGGDVELGDSKGNSYIIKEGTKKATVINVINDNAFVDENYKVSLTSIKKSGGFTNISLINPEPEWPTSLDLVVENNPTTQLNLVLSPANEQTHYFINRQSEFNSEKFNESIPVNLKLLLSDGITTIPSKETFSGIIKSNKGPVFNFVFGKGEEEITIMLPLPNLDSEIDSMGLNGFELILDSADDSQFEKLNLVTKFNDIETSLKYTIHNWKQNFIRLSAPETYEEGSGTALIDVIQTVTSTEDVTVILNTPSRTQVVIPPNQLQTQLSVEIRDDSPYVDLEKIVFDGIYEAKYYGNPTPPDLELYDKAFQDVYVSKESLAIKILDTIDITNLKISTTTSVVESRKEIKINYVFDNIPDPLSFEDIKIKIAIFDLNDDLLKEEIFTNPNSQNGIMNFTLPDIQTAGEYNIISTYLSGGNFEQVKETNTTINVIPRPNRISNIKLEIEDNIKEKQKQFDITATIKNTAGESMVPRNKSLIIPIIVEIGPNAYTKFLTFKNLDIINNIAGDSTITLTITDKEVGNDIYKNTAPVIKVYINTNESLFEPIEYDFDEINFINNIDNKIEIIPEDTIDITNIQIDKVVFKPDNNPLLNYGIVGSKVIVTVSIDQHLGSNKLNGDIVDSADNVIGSFEFNELETSKDIETTILTMGEFKPSIKNIGSNNFESINIKDNDKTLVVSPKPDFKLKLKTDKQEISEDIGSGVSESFELGTEIEYVMIPAFMGKAAFVLQKVDYDKAYSLLTDKLTIKYEKSIDSKNITNEEIILEVEDGILDLNKTSTISYDLDDSFINNNKYLSLKPLTVDAHDNKVNVIINDDLLNIKILDDRNSEDLEGPILSISSTEPRLPTGEYSISEKGGVFGIDLSLSETANKDMTIKLKVLDANDNPVKDENNKNITLDVIISNGTKGGSNSIIIPDIDDIYIGNKLEYLKIIPDLSTMPDTGFEALKLSNTQNELKIILVDSLTNLYFNIYLTESADGTLPYKLRIPYDAAGPGDYFNEPDHYSIIFQGFNTLVQDPNNSNNYIFRNVDLKDDDEITFKLTEKIMQGPNGTGLAKFKRSRFVTITGKDLVPSSSLVSNNRPGLSSEGLSYELKYVLQDYYYIDNYTNPNPESLTQGSVTMLEEMKRRFNMISGITYNEYIKQPNALPFTNVKTEGNFVWSGYSQDTIGRKPVGSTNGYYIIEVSDITSNTLENVVFNPKSNHSYPISFSASAQPNRW